MKAGFCFPGGEIIVEKNMISEKKIIVEKNIISEKKNFIRFSNSLRLYSS